MREKLNVKSNMVMIIIRFLRNNPKLRLEYFGKNKSELHFWIKFGLKFELKSSFRNFGPAISPKGNISHQAERMN